MILIFVLEMALTNKLNRGSIWWVNLDPTIGSEIQKKRPCVIISHSNVNEVRKTVIIVPLSSSPKAYPPIAISVKCQEKMVVAVCDQIRAIDKSRLLNFIENMDVLEIQRIEQSLKKILVLP